MKYLSYFSFVFPFIHWHISRVERNQELGVKALPSAWGLLISLLVWKGLYGYQKYNLLKKITSKAISGDKT